MQQNSLSFLRMREVVQQRQPLMQALLEIFFPEGAPCRSLDIPDNQWSINSHKNNRKKKNPCWKTKNQWSDLLSHACNGSSCLFCPGPHGVPQKKGLEVKKFQNRHRKMCQVYEKWFSPNLHCFPGQMEGSPGAHPRGPFSHCHGDMLPSTLGRSGTADTMTGISIIWAVEAC